jgi:hypothetical protein
MYVLSSSWSVEDKSRLRLKDVSTTERWQKQANGEGPEEGRSGYEKGPWLIDRGLV